MNRQSKLLLVFGVFVSTATCSGQQPLCKNSMMHFASEIVRVDSILSTSSCHKQSTSLHNIEIDKDSIRFEFIHNKIKQKRGTMFLSSDETDRPKKI